MTASTALIVDNDSDSCSVISGALAEYEYNCLVAASETEITKAFKKKQDFSLLFVNPMVLDAKWKFLLLKTRETFHHGIPLIVTAENPTKELVEKARESGACDVIVKPIVTARLRKTLDSLFARQAPPDDDVPTFEDITALILTESGLENKILTENLAKLKVGCFTANDWLGGIAVIQKEKPSVIFVSTTLSNVDSSSIAKSLKRMQNEKRMIVLIESKQKSSRIFPVGVDFIVPIEKATVLRLAEILNQFTTIE